jgi:hypothetical protein
MPWEGPGGDFGFPCVDCQYDTRTQLAHFAKPRDSLVKLEANRSRVATGNGSRGGVHLARPREPEALCSSSLVCWLPFPAFGRFSQKDPEGPSSFAELSRSTEVLSLPSLVSLCWVFYSR